MAAAPVPTPTTLKILAEVVESRVMAAVLVKDRKSTGKQIKKYFAEWEDLGFLSKKPEAPAPDGPALEKIINLIKDHHGLAAAEYTKAGSPTWGLKKQKWDKAQNKYLIVTAMTNMMKKYLSSATNPPVYTDSANTSHTPSAPPQSAVGLYPVIHDPLPNGDANRSLQPTIQAPVFHITSGQVNLESDTMDAAKKAYRKLNERVDCLDHQLQDLQQRADRETGTEVHSSQEGGASGPLLMDLDAPITSSTPLCPQPSLLTGGLSRNKKQDQLSASGAPDLPYAFPTTNYPPPTRFPPVPRPRRQDGAIPPKDQDNYQETTSIRGKFTGKIEGSMIPKKNDAPPLAAAMSSPPSSHTRQVGFLKQFNRTWKTSLTWTLRPNQTGDAQWHIVSPNIGDGKKLRPTRTGLSPDSYKRPSWQRRDTTSTKTRKTSPLNKWRLCQV